jgi:hypothetical protein
MTFDYRNPIYNRFGTVDCEINHPIYGWIPFTASPEDSEQHGRDLYQKIIAEAEIAPAIEPSDAELAAEIRAGRDRLLAQSDWTQLPDVPVATAKAWATYRQQLRDITAQPTFPHNVTLPQPPQPEITNA